MIDIVNDLINKTFKFGLRSFINDQNELIVYPKINAYFRLEDVNSELDFKCKVLHWLTFFTASNHWEDKTSPKMIKYINYILGTNFNKKEFDALYCNFGNGLQHELCVNFIKNGCDITYLKKENCSGCYGKCFLKEN